MSLTIDLAVAKTHKFAVRESGDTAEVVERPGGGISLVVVDGQGSGPAAKRLSLMIAGRVVSMLNEGVRDGAAARAAHDFLYSQREGRVSAALDIISIDLVSGTVLCTRNSEVPMLIRREAALEQVSDSGGRIGMYRHTRPRVLEFPASCGLSVVLVTDGVVSAGRRYHQSFDLLGTAGRADEPGLSAQSLADRLLGAALEVDQGRPADDMTVVALKLWPGGEAQPIRRLSVSLPLAE